MELKWNGLAELMEVISWPLAAHGGAVMSSWRSLWSFDLPLELKWKGLSELMEVISWSLGAHGGAAMSS